MHLELSKGSTYGDYLRLDELLAAQRPVDRRARRDAVHHPASHQRALDQAAPARARSRCRPRSSRPARPSRSRSSRASLTSSGMLFEQWAVLETMTPSEYLQFRDALGNASGFQSYQYRALEFVLGNKDAGTLEAARATTQRIHAELTTRLAAPSIYDEFLRWLARHGYAVPADKRRRATSRSRTRRATRCSKSSARSTRNPTSTTRPTTCARSSSTSRSASSSGASAT